MFRGAQKRTNVGRRKYTSQQEIEIRGGGEGDEQLASETCRSVAFRWYLFERRRASSHGASSAQPQRSRQSSSRQGVTADANANDAPCTFARKGHACRKRESGERTRRGGREAVLEQLAWHSTVQNKTTAGACPCGSRCRRGNSVGIRPKLGKWASLARKKKIMRSP